MSDRDVFSANVFKKIFTLMIQILLVQPNIFIRFKTNTRNNLT